VISISPPDKPTRYNGVLPSLPQANTHPGDEVIHRTPVAGLILHGGSSSPNLQFCKLYPADFSVAIFLVCVFLASRIFLCFVWFKNPSRDFSKQDRVCFR